MALSDHILGERLLFVKKKVSALWKWQKSRRSICGMNALYPASLVKPARQVEDEIRHIILTRKALPFQDIVPEYFAMGLNYNNAVLEDYVFWNEWKNVREQLDRHAGKEIDMIRNKLKHGTFLSMYGLPVPRRFGVLVSNGSEVFVLSPCNNMLPLVKLLQSEGSLFCKPFDGYGGRNCMRLDFQDCKTLFVDGVELSFQYLTELLKVDSLLLVESVVCQHPEIAAFHPDSINTLRIVTMRRESGDIEYLQSVFRIGAGQSRTDNITSGGICVGVAPDGALGFYGCRPYAIPSLPLSEHPDTHMKFWGFIIPYFSEARELVCWAHACFSSRVHSVSWDVAITPGGPVIIECNARGGSTIMQRAHGGWRGIFNTRLIPAARKIRS